MPVNYHGQAQPMKNSKNITSTTVLIGGETIDLWLYRSPKCQDGGLLIVFHGYERDAENYLKGARRLARSLCMTVVAPRFTKEQFPNWRYQRAGAKRSGDGIDLTGCIGPMLQQIVDWARLQVNRPEADYVLFGHSAGAQMLSRVAAYCPLSGPRRIVIANPSSYVAPTVSERVPYGFKGVGNASQQTEFLRRYLAQPITIYLGGEDTGDWRLLNNRAARRQGANRRERGRRIYSEAAELAAREGWTFNWRLVEAPGIGHVGRAMLRAPEALSAIGSERIVPVQPRPEGRQ